MKRVVVYSLVFVMAFATSLLIYLPANIVIKQISLPAPLQLSGIQGTIWQGSVEQVNWQNHSFGDLLWKVNPSALFSGKLEASVRFGRKSDLNLRGKGLVGYSLQGPYAHNLVLSMPMDEALKQVPMPLPVVAKGQFELTIKDYIYQTPYCLKADGVLAWNAAGIESPLGALELEQTIADLSCRDNTVTVKGSQNSVQVSSEYSAKLSPNRRYQAEGWFKPGAEFPDQFSNQLKWLPEPDNQGRYEFKQQGRL